VLINLPFLLLILAFPLRGAVDVAYLLDAGKRILDGNLPYVDFLHLFILTFIPWLFLRWLRAYNISFPRVGGVLFGIIAAIAFSIKPHYVLALFILEVVLLTRTRHWRLYLQPEFVGAAIVVGIYGLYAMAFPQVIEQFFETIVPQTYYGYMIVGEKTFLDYFWGMPITQLLVLLAIPGLILSFVRGVEARLLQSITLALIASLCAFALQAKGFVYHLFPAFWLSIFLVYILIMEMARRYTQGVSGKWRVNVAFITTASLHLLMIILSLYLAYEWVTKPYGDGKPNLIAAIQDYTLPQDAVLILDGSIENVYPTIVQTGRWQALDGFLTAGTMFSVYYNGDPSTMYTDEHVPPPSAQVFIDDMLVTLERPTTRLVLIFQVGFPYHRFVFNTYQYLMARPAVRALLNEQYVYVDTINDYRIYRRQTP
jgi:hypothetical protein